ncbi:MAG: hypothetical protein GF334_06310 [Candidatus Altiarchaeales archaeon]|nr:hypothetical protein [Candidatus Altiarchaeales archaeon]
MNYFLIDAFNLAYRAHNVNYELRTIEGLSSGMFYGFLRTIFSLKKKYRGYKFIVVWDNHADHKFDLNPEYKSGRTPLPQTVTQQISDIKKYLQHCGIDQYEKKGQEADDVIASLVEMFKGEGNTVIVYSNDKDFLQLVETGRVIVYKPKVGLSPEKFYDEEAVIEKFGVSPSKLACFRSFAGDSSDALNGVPRVPRKIIAGLVNEHEEIERVYDSLEEVKLTDFQRKMLMEHRGSVETNFKIIKLDRYLEGLEKTEGAYEEETLKSLLKKYEVKSINPAMMIDLFSSSLNIKYTDPRDNIKLESYSLF